MYIPPVKQLQHAPSMETGDPDDVSCEQCGQVYTSKEQDSWIGCGTYVVVKFGGTTSVVCDEHCQL